MYDGLLVALCTRFLYLHHTYFSPMVQHYYCRAYLSAVTSSTIYWRNLASYAMWRGSVTSIYSMNCSTLTTWSYWRTCTCHQILSSISIWTRCVTCGCAYLFTVLYYNPFLTWVSSVLVYSMLGHYPPGNEVLIMCSSSSVFILF